MFYQYQHFGSSNHFCKEYGKNFNYPMHIHRSFEVIVLLSGSMDVWIGKKRYTLRASDAVLVFPNQAHTLESAQSEHMLLIFSPDLVSAYTRATAGSLPANNLFSISPALLAQLSALSDDSSHVQLKAALYSLCAQFDESAEYRSACQPEGELLPRIFSFVEQHFETDCSLDRLHAQLGYSTSYLSRYFKEFVGVAYVTFVNQYRISKACFLLANTDKTVLECSLDCGYTSLRSFNRNFKLLVGETPNEYRTRNR